MNQPEQKLILVTGGNGQLGSELKQLAPLYPMFHFLFTDVNDLDITSANDVLGFFRDNTPYACINCAAYTNVDKAEEEQEQAYAINSTAVRHISIACRITNTKLILMIQ